MWTASLSEKRRVGFQLRIAVIYTNGTENLKLEYTFDGNSDFDAFLKNRIKAQITSLEQIDDIAENYAVGPIALPVPTPDEVAKQAFIVLLNDWKAKKLELEAATKGGVTTKLTQADVDAALSAWKAVYKDDYAPFIVGLF